MQPYQSASEELQRQARAPGKALKSAAIVGSSIAGSLAGGGAILNRVLPFLNQYIPDDLMQKGLSKIDPRLGKFIERSKDLGYSIDEIKDYMTKKMSPEERESPESSENPIIKEAKIFQSNYPDVAQAITNLMNQGQNPQEAAAILKESSPFYSKIQKLEKEIGKNFVDFITELMGSGQQGQTMQQPQQAQQPGGVDPQLMQLVQGIRSSLQGLRGG